MSDIETLVCANNKLPRRFWLRLLLRGLLLIYLRGEGMVGEACAPFLLFTLFLAPRPPALASPSPTRFIACRPPLPLADTLKPFFVAPATPAAVMRLFSRFSHWYVCSHSLRPLSSWFVCVGGVGERLDLREYPADVQQTHNVSVVGMLG
jgi:hypothetical protein